MKKNQPGNLLDECLHIYITQWWSFAGMSQQGVDFSKKINKTKYFFDLTSTDVNMDHQKLGPILENKVVQKLKILKIVNNKKPASKLIFFNEKKIEKDLYNF